MLREGETCEKGHHHTVADLMGHDLWVEVEGVGPLGTSGFSVPLVEFMEANGIPVPVPANKNNA